MVGKQNILVSFPFIDLTTIKLRPALVLLKRRISCNSAFIFSRPSCEVHVIPEAE
jgi:hypothetical protein